MDIEAGYKISFNCLQEVPMVLMLNVHPSRMGDLRSEHAMRFSRPVRQRDYLDAFGNICTRLVAPAGVLEISNRFVISDSGLPDDVAPGARQIDVDQLPDETLGFLLGSRYCDTQKLTDLAWSQFGGVEGGWQRVRAICDYVHDRIEFGYQHARGDRTAFEGYRDMRSVAASVGISPISLLRSADA
jgi:transglutaminase-like putative cysteine protease